MRSRSRCCGRLRFSRSLANVPPTRTFGEGDADAPTVWNWQGPGRHAGPDDVAGDDGAGGIAACLTPPDKKDGRSMPSWCCREIVFRNRRVRGRDAHAGRGGNWGGASGVGADVVALHGRRGGDSPGRRRSGRSRLCCAGRVARNHVASACPGAPDRHVRHLDRDAATSRCSWPRFPPDWCRCNCPGSPFPIPSRQPSRRRPSASSSRRRR